MKKLIAALALLSLAAQPALAREMLYLPFERFDGTARLDSGAAVESGRARTWSGGPKQNYLVLNREPDRDGVTRRHYSTPRDFVGRGVTHQVVDSILARKISHSTGERPIREIRALSGDAWKDLKPAGEPVAFGDGLRFEFTMTSPGRQH